MQPIEALLTILHRTPGLDAVFNEFGCDPEQLEQFEATLGLRLADDVRQFLAHHDGQPPDSPLVFPPGQLRFLPLTEIIDLWNELAELEDEDTEFFDSTEDHDRVRAVMYHRHRVPLATYELGTQYIFLDYIPGPGGQPGQLIFNPNESDFRVLADSFTALISTYVTLLDAGVMAVQPIPAEFGHGFWFTTGDPRHPLRFDEFMRLA